MVGNYVARYYHFAVEAVRDLQKKLQNGFDSEVAILESAALALLKEAEGNLFRRKYSEELWFNIFLIVGTAAKPRVEETVRAMLTEFTVKSGDTASAAWRDIFPVLLTTYRDGFIVKGLDTITVSPTASKYQVSHKSD